MNVFVSKWGFREWNRHGLILVFAGLMYISQGLVVADHIIPGGGRYFGLVVARTWMDLQYWGYVWVFAGVLAIISARWPKYAETWGYMALTGLAAGWGAFYLMGVIFADTAVSNLSSATSWFLIAFVWWAVSGLTAPIRLSPSCAAVVVINDGRG